MSAIAAHYASSADSRRYPDLSSYDPSSFFSYPSLEGTYALTASSSASSSSAAAAPSSCYVWDTHHSASSSATLPLNPTYSSSSSAHSGPSSLPTYPAADYPSHRVSSRSTPFPSRSTPFPSRSTPLPSRSTPLHVPSHSSPSALPALSSCPPPPRLQNAQWHHNALYTIEPSHTLSPPPPSPDHSTPSSPPIKEEDPELGSELGFVIEVSVPAEQPLASPMPEVPLRATHAPPKMRKMMYSFRLENFAIHDGIRSAATQPGSGGIQVGPLSEKPIELEWQLDLVPHHSDALRYGPPPSMPAPSPDIYRAISPPSARLSATSTYPEAPSPSPPLSVDYSPAVDSDSWDASSAYGSVADSGSGSTPGMNASPTFPSVMTPAQSLGWNLRYGDVDLDTSSAYRRPASVQSSLSRVSQPHGQYMLSATSSKSPYHQQQPPSQYGYESTAFSSRGSSSRYPDPYPSSTSSWYRSS